MRTYVDTEKQGRHRHLQLVRNEWDPATQTSRPEVLHSFGCENNWAPAR